MFPESLSGVGMHDLLPKVTVGQRHDLAGLNNAMSVKDRPPKAGQVTKTRTQSWLLRLVLLVLVAIGATACGGFRSVTGDADDPWRRIRIEDVPEVPKPIWAISLTDPTEQIGKMRDVGDGRLLVEIRRGIPNVESVDIALLDLVDGHEMWRTRVSGDDGRLLHVGSLLGWKQADRFGVTLHEQGAASLVFLSAADGRIIDTREYSHVTASMNEDELVTLSMSDQQDPPMVREYRVEDLQNGPALEYALSDNWGGGLCLGETALLIGQVTETSPMHPCYSNGPAFAVDRRTGESLEWAATAGLGKHFYPLLGGALKIALHPLTGVADIFLLDRDGDEVERYSSEERLLGYRMVDTALYVMTKSHLSVLEMESLSPVWKVDVSSIGPSHIVGVIDGSVLVATAEEIVWFDAKNGDRIQAVRIRPNTNDHFLSVLAISRSQVVLKRSDGQGVIHELVAHGNDGELAWAMAVRPSQQIDVLGGRLVVVDQDQGSIKCLG